MTDLKRTPLLGALAESTDERIRRAMRSKIVGDDPESRQRHFRELERVNRQGDYFQGHLEHLYKTVDQHDKTRVARVQAGHAHSRWKSEKTKKALADAHAAHEESDTKLKAAHDRIAREAHHFDHPAGQYLDPKRYTSGESFMHSLYKVSRHPEEKKHAVRRMTGGTDLDFWDKRSVEHAKKSIKSHGLRAHDHHDFWDQDKTKHVLRVPGDVTSWHRHNS